MRMKMFSVFACVAIGLGCGSTDGPLPNVFSSAVKEIVVEVDYQSGAVPATGNVQGFGDLWNLFRTNVEALFAGQPRTVTIPSTSGQMEELRDITQHDFTSSDIRSIADAHRKEQDTEARRSFYALFLDGYFMENNVRQKAVGGITLGDSSVIAVFKPVMKASGAERFVEQSTLIHEFGHTVGLVHIDLPMVSPHEDPSHKGHCSNKDCVMYYLNEGAVDLILFIQRFVKTGTEVLFQQECLNDSAAASK